MVRNIADSVPFRCNFSLSLRAVQETSSLVRPRCKLSRDRWIRHRSDRPRALGPRWMPEQDASFFLRHVMSRVVMLVTVWHTLAILFMRALL